ncbi:MAG: fibronectin type III domain-containing protein [Oscillospiraceae bacterium]|nr:fibronectin type III domain-containing protein [Oscillospiraceae bacterium]
MKLKAVKAIAKYLTAAVLAAGVLTAVPEYPLGAGIAVTASAETTADGLVIGDVDGKRIVTDYAGEGGAVKIPADVDGIGAFAFSTNNTVTSLSVPSGVSKSFYIGDNAFYDCCNLKTVSINANIASVGKSAFHGCINLETVTFKGNVTTGIGSRAFANCHKLKKVDFTKSNAKLGGLSGACFENNFELSEVNMPERTGAIYGYNFNNCPKLTSLRIPEDTKIVGTEVFGYMYGCKKKGFYTVPDGDGQTEQSVKADGKKSLYVLNLYSADSETYKKNGGALYDSSLFSGDKKITQQPITLIVAEDSDAERYAKENGIDYKYGTSEDPSAPSGFKTSKTGSSVTLTWNEVEGAALYKVYMYNNETGKFTKYKDVKNPKCRVSGLEANTKYRFKVVVYTEDSDGKQVKGATSKTVSVTTSE